jgi:replicative superfamily II helicase
MRFVGINTRGINNERQKFRMNEELYNVVVDNLRRDEQCLVFVHSRAETIKTARVLIDLRKYVGNNINDNLTTVNQIIHEFSALTSGNDIPRDVGRLLERARAAEIRDLAAYRVGIHHAGLLRPDRNIVGCNIVVYNFFF